VFGDLLGASTHPLNKMENPVLKNPSFLANFFQEFQKAKKAKKLNIKSHLGEM
jgi:hypothetical protein